MSGHIHVEIANGVAWLTIDHEAKRNALTQAMWQSLAESVTALQDNPQVRVVVVRGAGDKAFSAGADITEFAELAKSPEMLAVNNDIVQVAQGALHRLTKPTIAMIYGACVGGGCGLALACDFRIAATTAKLGITPAKLGLLYSKADTRRLYNLVGPAVSREMLFTGKIVAAEQALAYGLVNEVVAAEDLRARVEVFALELAVGSQYSLRGIKQVLAALEGHGQLDDHELQGMFDAAFTADDCIEGCAAFLEKRQADFTWN